MYLNVFICFHNIFSYFFYIGSGVSCLCDRDQPGRAECRRDCPQANQRGVRSCAPGVLLNALFQFPTAGLVEM